MTTTGRPSKGPRDAFGPSFTVPVANLIRHRASTLGLPAIDYMAAALSTQCGLPWTSPGPVRAAGGLDQMIVDHNLPAPTDVEFDDPEAERQKIMLRVDKQVGAIIRDQHAATGKPLARIIAGIIDDFHRTETTAEVRQLIA